MREIARSRANDERPKRKILNSKCPFVKNSFAKDPPKIKVPRDVARTSTLSSLVVELRKVCQGFKGISFII